MNFFDEATWGPIVNELDRRTRYWLQARQAAWQFFTEAVRELLKDEIAISMKLVVEMARYNARKVGIGVRISNSYTTYVRDLICVELPAAEKYLTGGRRKVKDEDELSLED
ncbi:hypothetical protein LCGC14_0898090 [marine sediment metagenome]|uniref:Uncharacterized protein n=1 Tax=marine sediment metagenome TaxID=412755 RepID=A0A0F9NX75_9ZZZZ